MRRIIVPITIAALLVASGAFAQISPPVKAAFIDGQNKAQFLARSFVEESLQQPPGTMQPLKIYWTAGIIEPFFDDPLFRADGAIMPTNTALNLSATYPGTQQILIKRVENGGEFNNLYNQVKSHRYKINPQASNDTPVLTLGTDIFTAKLAPSPKVTDAQSKKFPSFVCLIATDTVDGKGYQLRDFLEQERLREGIRACLDDLDRKKVRSVVMPLIGAASYATAAPNQNLDRRQRELLRCRLVNSISGIALGISDFAPSRRSILEIGVVQWDRDIERMFRPPQGTTDVREKKLLEVEYTKYATRVKDVIARKLNGDPKDADKEQKRDCNQILEFTN